MNPETCHSSHAFPGKTPGTDPRRLCDGYYHSCLLSTPRHLAGTALFHAVRVHDGSLDCVHTLGVCVCLTAGICSSPGLQFRVPTPGLGDGFDLRSSRNNRASFLDGSEIAADDSEGLSR